MVYWNIIIRPQTTLQSVERKEVEESNGWLVWGTIPTFASKG
jgi:hypothetical protein